MRVHCACERTESRESNKIEFVFTHLIVCTIIFFSVKTPCRITRKKNNTKRTCLLIKFIVHIFQFVSVVDWNIISIPS